MDDTTTESPNDRSLILPPDYAPFLEDFKERIRTAQLRAAVSINSELVRLYWNIGKRILAAQQTQGWGAKIIDRLAADLHHAFPEMKGFSRTNLLYMRGFAAAWPDELIVQQAVGQIPWGHNITLLEKLHGREERLWYAQKAIEFGWSRSVLALQIGS